MSRPQYRRQECIPAQYDRDASAVPLGYMQWEMRKIRRAERRRIADGTKALPNPLYVAASSGGPDMLAAGLEVMLAQAGRHWRDLERRCARGDRQAADAKAAVLAELAG